MILNYPDEQDNEFTRLISTPDNERRIVYENEKDNIADIVRVYAASGAYRVRDYFRHE